MAILIKMQPLNKNVNIPSLRHLSVPSMTWMLYLSPLCIFFPIEHSVSCWDRGWLCPLRSGLATSFSICGKECLTYKYTIPSTTDTRSQTYTHIIWNMRNKVKKTVWYHNLVNLTHLTKFPGTRINFMCREIRLWIWSRWYRSCKDQSDVWSH